MSILQTVDIKYLTPRFAICGWVLGDDITVFSKCLAVVIASTRAGTKTNVPSNLGSLRKYPVLPPFWKIFRMSELVHECHFV